MAHQALLLSTFLLFLSISLVLCQDDYNHFYSNHYRKSTLHDRVHSTEATGPLAAGYSSSNSDSYNENNETVVIIRIVIGVGCIVSFLIALCVFICCRPACCRGKRNAGYVLCDNAAQPQQLGPQPPLMHTAQQLPNDFSGHSFPPVQQQHYPPEQHQFQTSQEQYPNPPVVPPPYSEKY